MEYTTNAPAGAALLEEKMPGWRTRINLETLDLSHPEQCVLGQLYGDFTTGQDMLFFTARTQAEWESCYLLSAAHGFSVGWHSWRYPDLQADWEHIIASGL